MVAGWSTTQISLLACWAKLSSDICSLGRKNLQLDGSTEFKIQCRNKSSCSYDEESWCLLKIDLSFCKNSQTFIVSRLQSLSNVKDIA